MEQMTVCQTCGSEGFQQLLIHCIQCQIVAVHRYCVDGPSTIDDEEINWSCEDCVPRRPKPTSPCRKSQRVSATIEREVLRKRARRNWRNDLSLLEAEKPDSGREIAAAKVKNNIPNVGRKCKDRILDCQRGKLEKVMTRLPDVPDDPNTRASANVKRLDDSSMSQHEHKCVRSLNEGQEKVLQGRSPGPLKQSTASREQESREPAPPIRLKKKDLNSNNGVKRMTLEAVVLTGEKNADSSSNADDDDQQVKLEKSVGPELSVEADCIKENTSKTDVKNGNSISEKKYKHGQSWRENDLNTLEGPRACSQEDEERGSDPAGDLESEVVQRTIADSLDPSGEDVQSNFARPRKKRRTLIIQMECSDEEPDNIVANHAPTNRAGAVLDSSFTRPSAKLDDQVPQPISVKSTYPIQTLTTSVLKFAKHMLTRPLPPEFDQYVPPQPIADAIWRGHCSISNSIYPLSFGLEAHLSNKALPRVHDAACALPNQIEFEIVSKRYTWPKSFEKVPPSGDAIGLYFFPQGERDERLYDDLLDKMIDKHQMLMSQINNLELLVFCSRELPEDQWRLQSKYYLWGVFRQRQENSQPSRPVAVQMSDVRPPAVQMSNAMQPAVQSTDAGLPAIRTSNAGVTVPAYFSRGPNYDVRHGLHACSPSDPRHEKHKDLPAYSLSNVRYEKDKDLRAYSPSEPRYEKHKDLPDYSPSDPYEKHKDSSVYSGRGDSVRPSNIRSMSMVHAPDCPEATVNQDKDLPAYSPSEPRYEKYKRLRAYSPSDPGYEKHEDLPDYPPSDPYKKHKDSRVYSGCGDSVRPSNIRSMSMVHAPDCPEATVPDNSNRKNPFYCKRGYDNHRDLNTHHGQANRRTYLPSYRKFHHHRAKFDGHEYNRNNRARDGRRFHSREDNGDDRERRRSDHTQDC